MIYDSLDKQVLIFPDTFPLFKALRLKRQADGFTQVQLANMLGMGQSTLNMVELNKKRIPLKCLERVKSYLYNEMYIDGVLQTGEEHYYG